MTTIFPAFKFAGATAPDLRSGAFLRFAEVFGSQTNLRLNSY